MRAARHNRAMNRTPAPRRLLAAILAALAITASLPAKSSEWTDAQGTKFKAEPVGLLGPFALFKTPGGNGKRVLLRGLSHEDCLRFAAETRDSATLAADWAQARGLATRELIGRCLRVENQQLLPAGLAGQPEPEILVVLYGSYNDGESWRMIDNFLPTYRRIRQVFPGRLEALFFGVRHDEAKHRLIATSKYMPWLVADFTEQPRLGLITRLAPREGIQLLALSRDGVPLAASSAQDVAAVRQFVDDLTDLMRLSDPGNPATWQDRVHYLEQVRPVEFARSSAPPLLIGNPLRADGLRQRNVTRVEARLEVGADGKVRTARIAPDQGVPAALAPQIEAALAKSAVFCPAISNGAAMAGDYDYVLDVAAAPSVPAADAAWLRGDARVEIPIGAWLVLKPAPVPEQVFSTVERVDESGVHVLTPFEASAAKVTRAAQLTAFHTDWFAAAGAESVQPKEGDKQVVDGNELTWKLVKSVDGSVDLQSFDRRDYCIGYAWAELDLPAAMNGWLGIGSDDGLKIWLNGKPVHDRWIRRMSQVDDDIVPLKLRAGRNQILIKIQNATGDWSFIARLRVKAP